MGQNGTNEAVVLRNTIKNCLSELNWTLEQFSAEMLLALNNVLTDEEEAQFYQNLRRNLNRTNNTAKLKTYLSVIQNHKQYRQLHTVVNYVIPGNDQEMSELAEIRQISSRITEGLIAKEKNI